MAAGTWKRKVSLNKKPQTKEKSNRKMGHAGSHRMVENKTARMWFLFAALAVTSTCVGCKMKTTLVIICSRKRFSHWKNKRVAKIPTISAAAACVIMLTNRCLEIKVSKRSKSKVGYGNEKWHGDTYIVSWEDKFNPLRYRNDTTVKGRHDLWLDSDCIGLPQ